MDLYNCL